MVGLLALASPGPAAVFCVTGNGHAAIEVLASKCCNDGAASIPATASLEPSDSFHQSAACGPCVDLQVTSPSRLEGPAKTAIPGQDSPTWYAAVFAASTLVRTQFRPAGHVSTLRPAHEFLASVVVLI